MGAETSSSTADPAYFRWWHAVLIFLLANGLSALPAVVLGATAFTNSFSEPAVAPPDWLFAPLWFFLNVTSLIALSVIANAPQRTIQRRIFLASEAVGWGLYSIFTTVYFLLRSPSLGAIDTLAGLVVGVVSLVCAVRIDARAGTLILLRVLWLLLASYVAIQVALHNTDPFLAGFRG